jgi:hypothetical protein
MYSAAETVTLQVQTVNEHRKRPVMRTASMKI